MPSTRPAALATLLLAASLLTATPVRAAEPNPAREHLEQWRAAWLAERGLVAGKATPDTSVVGGGVAPGGSLPQVVAVLFNAIASNVDAQYCGGTLVGRQHVLTAAHCADFLLASDVAVLVGTQDLRSGGQRVAVSAIAVHPNWNPNTLSSDVAVLTLATPVTNIQPVVLVASPAVEAAVAPVGTSATIAGWGDTGSGPSPQLRQGSLPVADPSTCAFDNTIMCAGAPSHQVASCDGDSGGPLFVPVSRLSTRRVQIGVTSFGAFACALPGFTDGFARLATLGAWVKQQLRP